MRRGRVVVAMIAVAVAVTTLPSQSGAAPGAGDHQLLPGVLVQTVSRGGPDPMVAQVVRVAPDAPVRFRPVLARGSLASGPREATSAMCERVGGVVCVNADFAACPLCREPAGGVVEGGQLLRSFRPGHHQLSWRGGRPAAEAPAWAARLAATYIRRAPASPLGGEGLELARSQRELGIAGVNVEPGPDEVVVFTPVWAPATPAWADSVEVVLTTTGWSFPGDVLVRAMHGRPAGGPIPADGVVLVGRGAGAAALTELLQGWEAEAGAERHVVVQSTLQQGTDLSSGGHPVLLRGGVRQQWDRVHDPKARGRHPRTLVGWNAAGEVLLVVVDGRQPGRSGATLDEAADLLRDLGATEGINLDGGGSSTMTARCVTGVCIRNRPSDGRERLVPTALAVVGDLTKVQPLRASAEPPLATAAAPVEPDPASTAAAEPPAPAPAPPVEVAGETEALPTPDGLPPESSVAPDGLAWGGMVGWAASTRATSAAPSRRPDSRQGPGHVAFATATGSLVVVLGGLAVTRRRRRPVS